MVPTPARPRSDARASALRRIRWGLVFALAPVWMACQGAETGVGGDTSANPGATSGKGTASAGASTKGTRESTGSTSKGGTGSTSRGNDDDSNGTTGAEPSGSDEGTASNTQSDGATSGGSGEPVPMAPDGYFVRGRDFFDGNGKKHRFRGVARPSLEWNFAGENLSEADYANIASWGANVVRLALNQGFWLEGSSFYAANYRTTVDRNIAWAHAAGLDVILDLHWSDRGNFTTMPEQQRMADANSVTFWTSVAERYKDDGRVLFELYNEPHNVTWDVWRNGGDSGEGYTAAGMQQLYDAVPATGAHNLVIVGGLDWAYDLTGIESHALDGYNIAYATHLYDFPSKLPPHWPDDWIATSETWPVIITEFGSRDQCSGDYSRQVLEVADERGLSYTAWAWYPGGCSFPALIEDWSGRPTAAGRVVQAALSSPP